ncbi:MAG: hypothetical protein D4R64_15645 [Porphyromonadaceae bacterium]|nr:MAG: hypothetical protein D4R64_15645 [Porphyromonadaceae bacterium]
MDSTKSIRIKDQIREVILTDFAGIMKTPGSTIGKFILIAVGIEFLGACLDRQHIKATARSEKRFNSAIVKLFPKKYHHFVKKESVPNLYFDFRCPIIHHFKHGQSLFLCSAEDALDGKEKHLSYHPDGSLILVVEEFYRDLVSAGLELIDAP